MDRSSLNKVETTHDREKRFAFKARLAKKIDVVQEPVQKVPVPEFNGLSVGQEVVHPSLGQGTIAVLDHKHNEIVLDFVNRDSVSLVLSQVQSILAPVEILPVVVDDCFLDGTIDRDLRPIRPDTVDKQKLSRFRESPAPAPAPPVPVVNSLPVGASVWHPDLGACTVFSVDTKTNNIVLDFPETGKLEFVLSQLQSKLITNIKDAPAHAGQRSKLPVAKQPAVPVSEVLSVALPSVFGTWAPLKKYGYLTTERHLTSEQANDVIDILNGKPHRSKNTSYSVSWDDSVDDAKRFAAEQHLAERRATVQPPIKPPVPIGLPEPVLQTTKLSVTLPSVFRGLKHSDQYVFLTKTKRLTPEEANDILAVYEGSTPLMVETTFEILWDEELGASASGVHRETATPVAVVVEKPVPQTLSVELPYIFKTWRLVEQFTYLTTAKHFTTEEANNVLAVVDGSTDPRFDITWVDEILDKDKRLGYKDTLLKRVEEAAIEIDLDPPIIRTTEAEPILRTVKLSVTLPSLFQSMKLSDQYSFLVNAKRLTSDEANDILAVYAGSAPRMNGITFEILWDDEIGKTTGGVHREAETPIAAEKPVPQTLSVELPVVFKTWRLLEQFTYLTTTKHLTTITANNVIDVVSGALHPGIEITWDNGVLDRDKRRAYKESLLQKVEAASVEPELVEPQAVPISLSAAGVYRVMEEVTKKEIISVAKLSVVLPTAFQDWTASDRYIFLSKTKRLTPDESNNVIDLYNGKPNAQINLLWEDIAPADFSDAGVIRSVEELVTAAPVSVLTKLSVVLPQTFKNWDSAYQHAFLVQTKKLTQREAIDVLAVYSGEAPLNNKVQYLIIWSE